MKSICSIPMYIFFILMALLLLAGCMTARKAEDYLKSKNKLAEVCATNFPVHDSTYTKDSIAFDTITKAGEPVFLRDSFYIVGDTIVKTVYKQCPAQQTITKTVMHDSIIIRENTARVAALQQQLTDEKIKNGIISAQLNDTKAGRSKWRMWCLITWSLCGLYGFLKFKRLIPF